MFDKEADLLPDDPSAFPVAIPIWEVAASWLLATDAATLVTVPVPGSKRLSVSPTPTKCDWSTINSPRSVIPATEPERLVRLAGAVTGTGSDRRQDVGSTDGSVGAEVIGAEVAAVGTGVSAGLVLAPVDDGEGGDQHAAAIHHGRQHRDSRAGDAMCPRARRTRFEASQPDGVAIRVTPVCRTPSSVRLLGASCRSLVKSRASPPGEGDGSRGRQRPPSARGPGASEFWLALPEAPRAVGLLLRAREDVGGQLVALSASPPGAATGAREHLVRAK